MTNFPNALSSNLTPQPVKDIETVSLDGYVGSVQCSEEKIKTGLIYKATNKINGKCYVGQTYQSFNNRIGEHFYDAFNMNNRKCDSYFYRAVRKYGKDSWEWEILCEGVRIESLNEYEIFYVSFCGGFPYGYNSTSGGENGKIFSEETKKKLSESHKGRFPTEETRQKLSEASMGEKNHNFGKHHTEEVKQKISRVHKGKCVTEETKQKLSASHKGKHHSEETKRKISESKRERKINLI